MARKKSSANLLSYQKRNASPATSQCLHELPTAANADRETERRGHASADDATSQSKVGRSCVMPARKSDHVEARQPTVDAGLSAMHED